jgi:hypothetical protein
VTPFDHTLKAEFINEYYNMSINFTKSRELIPDNQLPQTMEIEELEKINERVREISQIAGDNAPSFIDCDKIVFMSEDNVIMGYRVISDQEE